MNAPALPSILVLSASLVLGAAAPPDDPPFFTGTVVDALNGRPLAGAVIDARMPSGGAPEWTAPATTDAQGRFTIPTSMVNAASGSTGIRSADVGISPAALPVGEEALVRADGREFARDDRGVIWTGTRSTASPTRWQHTGPLAKAARVQGGPPYRVRKEGYETRESRIFMLVLEGTIRYGGLEPDTGLVIPLVPLSRPDSRVGP